MFLFEVALLVDLYKIILSLYGVGKVPLESGFWATHCGTQPNLPISLSKKNKKNKKKNIKKIIQEKKTWKKMLLKFLLEVGGLYQIILSFYGGGKVPLDCGF